MEALKKKILEEGQALGTEIIKVDSFLNHQIDVAFMSRMGMEFKRRFHDIEVDKILTVEASGIAVACMTAIHFDYPPVVFAKKAAPNTMTEEFYGAQAKSFTKGTVSVIRVSKKYLSRGDRVLILDDFLAHGEAALAMAEVVEQAGAHVAGVGIIIEKGFQNGSKRLQEAGYRVESLAVVTRIENGKITFK